MSVEALAVVLHHSRAKGTDKVILLGIANHAGDGGAWPSVATLARYANVEERTVQRSLRALAALGEIEVHEQAGGASGVPAWRRPNRYEVLVSCPITCDRTAHHRVKPLAHAPADLWIDGVTPTSPGDAHVTGGVTPTSPGGVTPTSPEPSIEPSPNTRGSVVPQPQDARDRGTCSVCSLPEAVCVSRIATSGHEYAPKPRRIGLSLAVARDDKRSDEEAGGGLGSTVDTRRWA